jgi:hypothetical protein
MIQNANYGVIGGHGAASALGGGTKGAFISGGSFATSGVAAGIAGKGYGAGGSGAVCQSSVSTALGGAGAAGICIVYEYS